ncbi:hypothetical protein N9W84_00625 [bacterium]|nr:hypothetical protein [bacterium]
MFNLLDPSEFVKRFVATITLTKEDRNLFELGKLEKPQISKLAEIISEAQSGSSETSSLLERLKAFEFPKIEVKAPKKKKVTTKKKKTPTKSKTKGEELEEKQSELLEKETQALSEEKELTEEIKSLQESLDKAKQTKEPAAPSKKSKKEKNTLKTTEKAEPESPKKSKEDVAVTEESQEEVVVEVEYDSEETEEDDSEEVEEGSLEEAEKQEIAKKIRELKAKVEKTQKIREETRKTREEVTKTLDSMSSEELQEGIEEELEEESEEEYEEEITEDQTLEEASSNFKDFVSQADSEEELDYLQNILMPKFEEIYKTEDSSADSEYLKEKAEIESKISEKRNDLRVKGEKEGLLSTLGQNFYNNLKKSENLFDINDAVSVLASNIDTSADLINTEDYKYIFKSDEVKDELCKEISKENFNFTEMRSLLIASGIAQDEAEEGSSEEEAATSRYLALTQIMEKAVQVAGINEFSIGELSEKAGVSLDDYNYKAQYEEIIDQMLSSEEELSFSDDQKKILRAFCDILSEKIDFDTSEEETLDESFLGKFEESMMSLGKGESNENLINSLNYIYDNDIESLGKSIKNIKNYISEEVPRYEISPNVTKAVAPLFRDLLERKSSLSEEKKDLLDKYRINILSDYVDINQNLLSAKLLPFISNKVSLAPRDLRDFKDIIKYFLIIYDSVRNPFEEYKKFEGNIDFENFTNILENSSVSSIENNKDFLSNLFYSVSENPEKSALMIHDLYLANKFKDINTVGFERIINEENKNDLIKSFDKDSRLEIYTKDDLLRSLRTLIPPRGRVTFHSILHNIRNNFKPREAAPIIETEEEKFKRTEKEVSKKVQETILEKVKNLDLPKDTGLTSKEPSLKEEAPLENSEFKEFDGFIDLVSQRNMSKTNPIDFLNYISPFEKVKNFSNEEVSSFQKYIKGKINIDIVELGLAMKSESLKLLFGDLKLKNETTNVYDSILIRIGSIIFSKVSTAKEASEDLSKYIKAAREQNLSNDFFKKTNNLLKEPTVDEAKAIKLKTVESKERTPSDNSCESIKQRTDLSLYAFSLPSLKSKVRQLKLVSSNEYKDLKELCKKGNKDKLYSFVSNVMSKYSDDLSKEDLNNFFVGNKEMPKAFSSFLLESFGNEFVRPSSVLLGGSVDDQNIAVIVEDVEGADSDFSNHIYSQIKEIFSDRYSLAKNLFVALLGWNLEEGIYFDVDNVLIHVSRSNSRLAFDDIKNKIGFVTAKASQDVLNDELKVEFLDDELEEDFKRHIKYYDDYAKGEYSKEFLDMVKNRVQTPAIQEATTVKVVDKLTEQKKSEAEIVKDIADFCEAISLLNKSKTDQGLSPYKRKDLFGSQKYKKLLTNSKVSISKIIEKICEEEERSLSSIAALLFKPNEASFDSFLGGNFTEGLSAKQFSSSLGKLLNDLGKEEETLDYSKKLPPEAKKSFSTDQYYNGLSEKILEKMDPRIILGIIVQSAFFDKEILPDSEQPIEIIFSDDVIPVSREDFESQLNMLNNFVIASIKEMISEAIDISEKSKEEGAIAKPEKEEKSKASTSEDDKELSLFEKIKSQLSEDDLDRAKLYDISIDIASYKSDEMLSEKETEDLLAIWEEKAQEAPISPAPSKKKYKLKTDMAKKTESSKENRVTNEVSDFYKAINGYIVDQEEKIDNFNVNGKVFSFDLAEESLDDLAIALKGGDARIIAEEIPDYPEDVELILTPDNIEKLSNETERVSDKLIDARVSFDYLRSVPGTKNIGNLKELESKAREIFRSESGKDKYVFFQEDLDGLKESLLKDSSKVLGERDQEGVMVDAEFYYHKDIKDSYGDPATIIIVDPSDKYQSRNQYRNYIDAQSDDDIVERITNK